MATFFRDTLHIEPAFRDLLTREGFDSFEAWMERPVGETVTSESGREVRRLCLGSRVFYLKRGWEPIPLPWVLRKLVRGRAVHHRLVEEAHAAARLAARGFAPLRPVAWGQRRHRGLPREGFLLAEEIPGLDGSELWAGGSANDRARLVREAGQLLGAMHRAGFFPWLRMKDLIIGSPSDDPAAPLSISLIDLESFTLRPRRWTRRRALRSLAECFSYFVLLRPEPDVRQMVRFARAYLAVTPLEPSVRDLFAAVTPSVSRLIGSPGPFERLLEESTFLARTLGPPTPRLS